MGQAINDYAMLQPDDRVILGVSGGADSIALMGLMTARLRRIPVSYKLIPVMVTKYNGQDEQENKEISLLAAFMEQTWGLELNLIHLPLVEYLLKGEGGGPVRNTCFKCAQIRRAELFKAAERFEATKIALGHHKDDIIETILMNMLYRRELSAMLPRLPVFEGKMEIIRPLAYLEKRQLERYVQEKQAPVMQERCPARLIKQDQQRDEIRSLVSDLSRRIPDFKNNLFASFRNPAPGYLLDHLFKPSNKGVFKRP